MSHDPFGEDPFGDEAPREEAPRGAAAFGAAVYNAPKEGPRAKRPRHQCPYQNRLSHKDNQELQVHGFRPIIYGYCSQLEDCGSCAGTLYKPNLTVQLGWGFQWVPCPYCRPDEYRKKVERLKKKMRR